MGAWKVPIQVTQECYERAKSNGIVGPKRKRQRVASPTNNTMEQENAIKIENIIPPLYPHSRPVIMFSGASSTLPDDEKKVLHMGGLIARNCREATHLVMYKVQRTLKLMCCLSTSRYIVSIKWLSDSFINNRFLDEQQYIVDDVDFERKHNCNILKVLSSPDRNKLFFGKIFFITHGVVPARSALTEMVQCAGGVVEKQRRSLKHIQDMEPNTYFVITIFNDFHLVSDLIRANIGLYNAEFVMTSILTQKIPYDSAFKKNNIKKS
jgi:PAX-interacting protein 1